MSSSPTTCSNRVPQRQKYMILAAAFIFTRSTVPCHGGTGRSCQQSHLAAQWLNHVLGLHANMVVWTGTKITPKSNLSYLLLYAPTPWVYRSCLLMLKIACQQSYPLSQNRVQELSVTVHDDQQVTMSDRALAALWDLLRSRNTYVCMFICTFIDYEGKTKWFDFNIPQLWSYNNCHSFQYAQLLTFIFLEAFGMI